MTDWRLAADGGLQIFRLLKQCESAGDDLALNPLALARNRLEVSSSTGSEWPIGLTQLSVFDRVDNRKLC